MLLIRPGKRYLYAGEIFVSKRPMTISTVLGSCISVCLAAPLLGFGGINHFMGPLDHSSRPPEAPESYRYCEPAIQALIKRMLKLGSSKKDLLCGVFGGGKVIDLSYDIGSANINRAREVLSGEGIRVRNWDVGGRHGRRLVFKTHTGVARVYKVRSITEYFNEDGSARDPLNNSSMAPLTDMD